MLINDILGVSLIGILPDSGMPKASLTDLIAASYCSFFFGSIWLKETMRTKKQRSNVIMSPYVTIQSGAPAGGHLHFFLAIWLLVGVLAIAAIVHDRS